MRAVEGSAPRLHTLQQRPNTVLQRHGVCDGREAADDLPLPIHQELGEIPPDVAGRLEAGAELGDGGHGGLGLEAGDGLVVGGLGLQLGEKGILVLAVDVDLLELVKLGFVLAGAEGVDLLVLAGAWWPN